MKKSVLLLTLLAAIIGLSSCDDSKLTARLAQKAIEKDIFWENPYQTDVFKTGYFEIDTDRLLPYQRLKAAGMITFSIEKVVQKVQRSSFNWWSGTSYYYVDKNHYFIDVQLTEEGKKYVIDNTNPLKGRKDVIKDLKLNDPKLQGEEVEPDYMSNYEPVKIGNKEIAAGAEEEPAEVDPTIEEDSVASPEDSIAAPKEEPKAPKDEKKKSEYQQALDKVNEVLVTVKLGKIEIITCKEIYCPEEYVKLGKGECVAVYEFSEKTPFGYVLGAGRDGVRYQSDKMKLVRYEDLGWTLLKDFDEE